MYRITGKPRICGGNIARRSAALISDVTKIASQRTGSCGADDSPTTSSTISTAANRMRHFQFRPGRVIHVHTWLECCEIASRTALCDPTSKGSNARIRNFAEESAMHDSVPQHVSSDWHILGCSPLPCASADDVDHRFSCDFTPLARTQHRLPLLFGHSMTERLDHLTCIHKTTPRFRP